MTLNAYDPDYWTEDRIERAVERRFDALDARLMANAITQAEYDSASHEISQWANARYRHHVYD